MQSHQLDELLLLWWPLAVLCFTCIRASWVFFYVFVWLGDIGGIAKSLGIMVTHFSMLDDTLVLHKNEVGVCVLMCVCWGGGEENVGRVRKNWDRGTQCWTGSKKFIL